MRRRVQEWAFAALYGPGARVYDRFTDWLFLGEWERWQRAALSEVPASGLVVELGSGTGALGAWSASPTRAWVGCEVSRAMLRVARRVSGPDGPWFLRADVRAIPLADAAADAVVATFPTRYILDRQTAAEVRRVLKPDGRVVVVLSGSLTPHGMARRIRRQALSLFYGRREPNHREPFGLQGFVGTIRQVVTIHGEADIYVGTPG